MKHARVAPLPSEESDRYSYTWQILVAAVDSTRRKSGYSLDCLHLAPAGSSGFKPIRVDWYRPTRAGQQPVVLLSPILAGNDLYVREFARFYAARGIHALIVYRPKEIFSTERGLGDIETHFQESIIQFRQTIDWLETEKSVDATRIGTFGISLGAILTTILTAVEPRIKCSILGLPAGNLAQIIMTSKDKTIRKRRRAYLEHAGWNNEKGLEELKKVIFSDPIRFTRFIDPEKIVVIAAIFDRVLGFHRSMDLWKRLGRPRLILLPTGHYSAYLATPYLKMATYSFFRQKLH